MTPVTTLMHNVPITSPTSVGESVTAVELIYDADRPYEVTMVVTSPGHDSGCSCPPVRVTWIFARDLLGCAAAMTQEGTGHGDVRVAKGNGPTLNITLRSPAGQATLALPIWQVAQWLTRVYTLVPKGAEHLHQQGDVDAELAEILAGGAS
ncbi:SsgA family sporulation/cell division regulator [Nocardiopsis sp. NPDC049922]|uniref:SsgA family sporulation/cell division regulator n=1 Tax=Nocardiopsis sp. NPDC049922 TaxID=3155157 RepID=UPI0033E9AAEA